jgi:GST-like protein
VQSQPIEKAKKLSHGFVQCDSLIPSDPAGRARVFEQMFFHMTGIGPAFGQAGFFKRQASEQIPLAIARFQAEAERTLAVLDLGLSRSEFVAGPSFTIADIAHFGWLSRRSYRRHDIDQASFHVVRLAR